MQQVARDTASRAIRQQNKSFYAYEKVYIQLVLPKGKNSVDVMKT